MENIRLPIVCSAYNGLGCSVEACGKLHVCLKKFQGKCFIGRRCSLEHNMVVGDHNVRILRSANLLHKTKAVAAGLKTSLQAVDQATQRSPPENLRPTGTNVRPTSLIGAQATGNDVTAPPKICPKYNEDQGCSDDSCPRLHVCLEFVLSKCPDTGVICQHNICLGNNNMRILKQHQLHKLGGKEIVARVREGYETSEKTSRSADSTAADGAKGAQGGGVGDDDGAACVQARVWLPASLACSVCLEPFIRATTLGCSHTFCEDCVQQVKRCTGLCPLCRARIETMVRPLVVDAAIDEWLEDQDSETQRARRQLEAERLRETARPAQTADTQRQAPDGGLGEQGSRLDDRLNELETRVRYYLDLYTNSNSN